jgi:hypothetical protein
LEAINQERQIRDLEVAVVDMLLLEAVHQEAKVVPESFLSHILHKYSKNIQWA